MEDDNVQFEIGKSKSNDVPKKKKDDKAESRLKDHYNIGQDKDHDELKRKREDFAEKLRKTKRYIPESIFLKINFTYREEAFKQKRAFMGEGGTNTPAGASN
jgi:hypothetical protein